MATVADIMTKEVVSVRQDTPLLNAAELLEQHGFDGVPVVDDSGILVGIFTQYDLISSEEAMHIPTLQKVVTNLSVEQHDEHSFKEDTKGLSELTVKDVMNSEPLTLSPSAPLLDIISLFRNHHRVNPVPVVDESSRIVGVVSRYDIIKLFQYVTS